MAKRYYVATALALGVLFGYSVMPRPGAPGASRTVLSSLTVGDLDGDGQADALVLLSPASPQGRPALALQVTKGKFTHEVLDLAGAGPVHLARRGAMVYALDARDRALARAWLYRAPGAKVPDLLASNGPQARRYVWVDRGFLKLDAQTVIPGFSVGLVMIGDSQASLQAIGGAPAADGAWNEPVTPAIVLHVSLNAKHRVERIGYQSARMATQVGVHPGSSLAEMARHYPGSRSGDAWRSPRYGLVATLNAQNQARDFTIETPWPDPADRAPAPKRAPAKTWPGGAAKPGALSRAPG